MAMIRLTRAKQTRIEQEQSETCVPPSASDRAILKPSRSKIYGQSDNSPPLKTTKNLATNVFLTLEGSRNPANTAYVYSQPYETPNFL